MPVVYKWLLFSKYKNSITFHLVIGGTQRNCGKRKDRESAEREGQHSNTLYPRLICI